MVKSVRVVGVVGYGAPADGKGRMRSNDNVES